jgi:hypothetical protein
MSGPQSPIPGQENQSPLPGQSDIAQKSTGRLSAPSAISQIISVYNTLPLGARFASFDEFTPFNAISQTGYTDYTNGMKLNLDTNVYFIVTEIEIEILPYASFGVPNATLPFDLSPVWSVKVDGSNPLEVFIGTQLGGGYLANSMRSMKERKSVFFVCATSFEIDVTISVINGSVYVPTGFNAKMGGHIIPQNTSIKELARGSSSLVTTGESIPKNTGLSLGHLFQTEQVQSDGSTIVTEHLLMPDGTTKTTSSVRIPKGQKIPTLPYRKVVLE